MIDLWTHVDAPSANLAFGRTQGGAQSFPKNYNMTIGVDFLVKRVLWQRLGGLLDLQVSFCLDSNT